MDTLKTSKKKEPLLGEFKYGFEFSEKLKKAFLEAMYFLLSSKSTSENRPSKGSYVYFLLVFETVQLMSLFYYKEMPMVGWDHYSSVWALVNYVRLDYICFSLGLQYALLIFFTYVCLLPSVLICWLMLKYLNQKPLTLVCSNFTVLFPFTLSTELLFVPMGCLCFAYLKYPFPTSQYLPEYDLSTEIKGNWTFALALLMVGCHWLLLLVKESFMYETRHYKTAQVPTARASPYCDNLRVFVKYSQIAAFYFVMPENKYLYYLLGAVLNLAETANFIFYLPYYRDSVNTAFAAMPMLLSWFSVCFLLGMAFNNATMTLLLMVFISPFLVVVVHKLVAKRKQALANPKHLNTAWKCELYLRSAFIQDPEIFEQTIELIKTRKIEDFKMLFIWLSYNLKEVKEDLVNARLKLTPVFLQESNLWEEFQILRCLRIIQEGETSENYVYLKFNKEFIEAMQFDEKLVCVIARTWQELLTTSPSIQKLTKLMKEVQPKLNTLKSLYKELLKIDRKNVQLNTLFGTFLSDLFNKEDLGQQYMGAEFFSKEKNALISPFNPRISILTVSLKSRRNYQVIYANKNALDMLEYTYSEIVGLNIAELSPDRLGLFDNELLYSILNETLTTNISFPKVILLKKKTQKLIPVQLEMNLEAHQGEPCLILTFKKCEDLEGEVAVVEASGEILGDSELFAASLNLYIETCTGMNANELVPVEISKTLYRPFTLNSYTYLFSIPLEVHSKEFTLIVVFGDLDNLQEWQSVLCDGLTIEKEEPQLVLPEDEAKKPNQSVNFQEEPDIISYHSRKEPKETVRSMDRETTQKATRKVQRSSSVMSSSFGGSSKNASSISKRENLVMVSMVKDSVKNVKIAFVVVIVTFLCLNGVITYFFFSTIASSEEIGEANKLISERSELMVHSANIARVLDLESKGFKYLVPFERCKDIIDELVTDLSYLNQKVKAWSKDWNGKPHFDLYFENSIPVWESLYGKYQMEKKNLLDISSDFKKHLENIQQKFEGGIDLEDPSAFFLFRNGYGETSKYSFLSQVMYYEEWEYYISTLENYLLLTYLLTACVFFTGTLLVAWKLYKLQLCSNHIWNIVFNYPQVKVKEKLAKALERLEYLPFETNNLLINEENSQINKRGSVSFYKPWVSVSVCIGVLFCSVLCYFLTLNYSVSHTAKLLLTRPNYYESTADQLTSLLESWEWAKEITLLNTSASIYLTLTSDSYLTSPEQMLYESEKRSGKITEFYNKYFRSSLIPIDPSVKDSVFKRRVQGKPVFEKGLVSAIVFYRSLLKEIKAMSGDQALEELRKAYNIFLELEEEIKFNQKLYIEEIDRITKTSQNYTLLLILGICVFSIVYLVVVLKYVMTSIRSNIDCAWIFSRRLGLSKA